MRRGRRWPVGLGIGGAGLVAAYLIVGAWAGNRAQEARSSLEPLRHLVACEKASPPPTPESARPASTPIASEPATAVEPAPTIEEAIQAYRSHPERPDHFDISDPKVLETRRADTMALLSVHEVALRRFRAAPTLIASSDVFAVLDLLRLTAARARIALFDDRFRDAEDDLKTLFATARGARSYSQIQALVAQTGFAMALDIVEELLPRIDSPSDTLARLDPDPCPGNALRLLVEDLDAWSEHGFEQFLPRDPGPAARTFALLARPLSDLALARTTEGLAPILSACRSSYAVGLPRLEQHEAQVLDDIAWMPGSRHFRFRYAPIVELEAILVARTRLARLAATLLERHRSKTMTKPPAPVLDPLTDRPFLIEPDRDKTVLRSSADSQVRWEIPVRITSR